MSKYDHDLTPSVHGEEPIDFWADVELSEIIDEYSDDETIDRYIEEKREEFREEWFEYVAEFE